MAKTVSEVMGAAKDKYNTAQSDRYASKTRKAWGKNGGANSPKAQKYLDKSSSYLSKTKDFANSSFGK